MHKFLSLTRVTLKNSMGMLSDGNSKKLTTILLYGFLGICMLPLMFALYFFVDTMLTNFHFLDQDATILALTFYICCFITFFFAIFLVPSIFFFSNDGETLLALPLKPEVILGSKFITVLIYEYSFVFMVLLPSVAAIIKHGDLGIVSILAILLVFLLLPIYPLVLSSIISLLVMCFVPFFKNRDRFNLISSGCTIVLALGFAIYVNSASFTQSNPQELMELLLSGNNSLIAVLGYLFPNAIFAAKAIVENDILQLIFFLLISFVSLLLCLLLAKAIYFKGLIGFSETNSNRKKLSHQELGKAAHQKNRIITYTKKELKLLFRTPAYMMNCVATTFIVPILMLLIPLVQGVTIDASLLPQEIMAMMNDYWYYFLIGGIVIGLFIGNMGLVSSTSISREGTNLMFMKYIPMPLKDQLFAKVLSGVFLAVITDILTIVLFGFLFPIFPLPMLILTLAASLVSTVLANYIGIYLDLSHPKLVWEQEATAVKNSISGIIAMFGGWGCAALVGIVAYMLPNEIIKYASIALLIAMLILSCILHHKMDSFAFKQFKKY